MVAVILVAVLAVGFMVLGLCITLIRKGHNIQGDVGDNPHMQALGLECTMSQFTGGAVHCNVECRRSSVHSSGELPRKCPNPSASSVPSASPPPSSPSPPSSAPGCAECVTAGRAERQ